MMINFLILCSLMNVDEQLLYKYGVKMLKKKRYRLKLKFTQNDSLKCKRKRLTHLGKLFFHSVSKLNLVALNASACCSTVSLTIFQKHSDTAKLKLRVVHWWLFTTPPLKVKHSIHFYILRHYFKFNFMYIKTTAIKNFFSIPFNLVLFIH